MMKVMIAIATAALLLGCRNDGWPTLEETADWPMGRSISTSEVPALVTRTALALHPTGTVTDAQLVTAGSSNLCFVLWLKMPDGRHQPVKLCPDGTAYRKDTQPQD